MVERAQQVHLGVVVRDGQGLRVRAEGEDQALEADRLLADPQRPRGEVRAGVTTATAAARMLAPQGKPLSTLMTDRCLSSKFSVLDIPLDDMKATLDRSFADEMWSKDGMVSRAAWDTGKAVVMEAGILKTDVKYEEIFDMSFVESVRASL